MAMAAIDLARATLMAACGRARFVPPRDDQGLSAWADECLDVALAPRGAPEWLAGHAAVVDALEAALAAQDEHTVTAHLARARAIVERASVERWCACAPAGAAIRDAQGRARCAKCLRRT